MITKVDDGLFTVRCTGCDQAETLDTGGDLALFKEIIKERGWTTKHNFVNICEDCKAGGLK